MYECIKGVVENGIIQVFYVLNVVQITVQLFVYNYYIQLLCYMV